MSKELPSPELLRKLLRYEPETGKLFWRERGVEMFADGKQSAEQSCAWWNARYAEREAFTSSCGQGYKKGAILGRTYYAHRVIWVYVYGEWVEEVDHINGVKDDNRIENLRSVSHAENGKNKRRPSNNASGVIGVYWATRGKKWRAQIKINDKRKHLGSFTDLNEAVAARKAAEIKYGFHENHGRAD